MKNDDRNDEAKKKKEEEKKKKKEKRIGLADNIYPFVWLSHAQPVKGACGCIWQVIVFFASASCRVNSFHEGDEDKSNGDEYVESEKKKREGM